MEDTLLQEQSPYYRALTLADRCDRCGECSQAFVRVVKIVKRKEYELFFCGHHFNRYQPVLVANGWLTQDERNQINSKPMSGAPESALVSEE